MFSEPEIKIQQQRAERFLRRLDGDLFAEQRRFEARIAPSGMEHVAWEDRLSRPFHPISEGEMWGTLWESAYLHLTGVIPGDWRGLPVALHLNVGGEALLFSADGMPQRSFTNTSVFAAHYRREFQEYAHSAEPGPFELWLECAGNGMLGAETNPDCPGAHCEVGLIRSLRYGVFRPEVRRLKWKLEIALGLLGLRFGCVNCLPEAVRAAFPAGSFQESRLRAVIAEAIDVYAGDPANAARSSAILDRVLGIGAPAGTMQLTAVGHAHIDTGWLWPVRETVRKCVRTFANQISLLEKYPEYVFGASQPQHYLFVKERAPRLYEKIRAAVKAGRWELQGGMWVEADCNLPSGESLVRQFLHGKNFFRDEFGVDVHTLWLPDVFGYSGALPQISCKAGCNHFLTQKICWNNYNKFPYHAFRWYGIDRSELLAFFPPEDNYNALLSPEQLNYGADNFHENHLHEEFLSLFGIGDGGGGPQEDFIERGRLCADLNGSPRVRFGRADGFFARLEAKRAQLPAWHGELYFEMHRGTLTSQARIKRDNRFCEQQLAATEFLMSHLAPGAYPKNELDRNWKTLLRNQFHDILPGSSIGEVYAVAAREHAEILHSCEMLQERAARELFRPEERSLTCCNTLDRTIPVRIALPENWSSCAEAVSEIDADGRVFVQLELPPGFTVLHRDDRPAFPQVESADLVLENELIRYRFDAAGRLTEAFDKAAGRAVLAAPGNDFTLYVDRPTGYDAWNIERYYENEPAEPVTLSHYSGCRRSPLGSELTLEFACGRHSTIRQQVRLNEGGKLLEFDTQIQWHERDRMLRVAFPTSIETDEATFDIQYGFVRRPTRRNTSWDWARFEVMHHRYVDLSDAEYGAALLNDCKYGCKVLDGVIDLALLRSTGWPAENADRGEQRFRYGFLPHSGALNDSDVEVQAAAFNRPVLVFAGYDGSAVSAPIRRVAGDGVGIEVLKQAEKSEDLIVRVVALGDRAARGEFRCAAAIRRVEECDLMEWRREREIPLSKDNGFSLELKPFEIKTLRLSCVPAPATGMDCAQSWAEIR